MTSSALPNEPETDGWSSERSRGPDGGWRVHAPRVSESHHRPSRGRRAAKLHMVRLYGTTPQPYQRARQPAALGATFLPCITVKRGKDGDIKYGGIP
jgi:hypothetical protein